MSMQMRTDDPPPPGYADRLRDRLQHVLDQQYGSGVLVIPTQENGEAALSITADGRHLVLTLAERLYHYLPDWTDVPRHAQYMWDSFDEDAQP